MPGNFVTIPENAIVTEQHRFTLSYLSPQGKRLQWPAAGRMRKGRRVLPCVGLGRPPDRCGQPEQIFFNL